MIRILAPMGSRSFFGAERANVDLLRRMQQKGAVVKCLVRHEDWPENMVMRQALSDCSLAWQKATFPDYPTIRYWPYWPKVAVETPLRYIALNRLALRMIRDERITHVHLHNPFQAASLHAAIERSGVALIYRCGESPAVHNVFYRHVWSWLTRRAERFVTESDFVRAQMLDLGVADSKTRLIRTPPPARVLAARFSSPFLTLESEAKSIFCFVGQLTEAKGVTILLQAFALLRGSFPTAKLMLAAPIQNDFGRQLVSKWSAGPHASSIVFLGSVEDIPGLLKVCHVHVAPSVRPESYGLVSVEAKEAGLPSIVFAQGGLGELVEDGRDGIALTEKTPRALAGAMLTYCRDPARAKADGTRARESLTHRLHIHRHDDSWLDVYNQTLRDER